MKIELGEYLIRDWARGDAGSIVRYANNRKIAVWLRDRFPFPYTASDAKVFLARVAQQNPRTVFAIATQSEAIGGIEVTDLAPTDPSEPRCVLRCRLTEGQGTGPTM